MVESSVVCVMNLLLSFGNSSVGVKLARIRTPPIVTSYFLYVRFIGDRSIDEKDFGRIQKDRIFEMNKWAEEIKNGNRKRKR
jgi:hypothetical protein